MLSIERDSFGPVRMPDGTERSLVKTYLKKGFGRICEVEDVNYLALLAVSEDLLTVARKILALGIGGPYTGELEKIITVIDSCSVGERTKGAVYGE